MDKYKWDNTGHTEPSRLHNLSTGVTDKRQYPISNSGMTVKTHSNEHPNAMIRTDVTTEDVIWSKTLPNQWQTASSRGSLGVARAVSPSVHFGGEDVQYISDTESEQSCSSADTMILLNSEQSGSQILETCIPPRPRSYQPIHTATGPPPEYRSDSRQGVRQENTDKTYNQIVGLRNQQLTCNNSLRNPRHISGGSSAPPGVDNHSDDGYESNDTNMSFETGSSGSLSSKDSGQNAVSEAPKSILKKSGQSNSKLGQRSVRFVTDGATDKQLENRTYGVPRQYVATRSPKDRIQPVVAVKRKTDPKPQGNNESDSPSLEDRLRNLMVQESPSDTTQGSSGAYGGRPPSVDYRDSGRRPPLSSALTTIPEQYHSVDRTEETMSVQDSDFRAQLSPGPAQNGHLDDTDAYISTDKVKTLLNRQSSLRSSRSSTPTIVSHDNHKVAHYSSLTDLPIQKDGLPDTGMPHSFSMPQLSSEQNSQHTGTYGNPQNADISGYKPEVSANRSSASHELSPQISPKARQRHSCYATYAELTDMYRSMAAGGRNKRWSNSSEFSVNSFSSLRQPQNESSKSKTVYGTTADLYRMMKDQMKQPKPTYNHNREYNSVT